METTIASVTPLLCCQLKTRDICALSQCCSVLRAACDAACLSKWRSFFSDPWSTYFDRGESKYFTQDDRDRLSDEIGRSGDLSLVRAAMRQPWCLHGCFRGAAGTHDWGYVDGVLALCREAGQEVPVGPILCEALVAGNVELFERLMHSPDVASISARDRKHKIYFWLAQGAGQSGRVDLLDCVWPHLVGQNSAQNTAVSDAAERNHLPFCQAILGRLRAEGESEFLASKAFLWLAAAARAPAPDTLRWLQGALSVGVPDICVREAAGHSNLAMLEYVLENVQGNVSYGWAMEEACKTGRTENAAFLVQHQRRMESAQMERMGVKQLDSTATARFECVSGVLHWGQLNCQAHALSATGWDVPPAHPDCASTHASSGTILQSARAFRCRARRGAWLANRFQIGCMVAGCVAWHEGTILPGEAVERARQVGVSFHQSHGDGRILFVNRYDFGPAAACRLEPLHRGPGDDGEWYNSYFFGHAMLLDATAAPTLLVAVDSGRLLPDAPFAAVTAEGVPAGVHFGFVGVDSEMAWLVFDDEHSLVAMVWDAAFTGLNPLRSTPGDSVPVALVDGQVIGEALTQGGYAKRAKRDD